MMLCDEIQSKKDVLEAEDYAVPSYITDNLKYPLFDWQKTALENFLVNERVRKMKAKKGEMLLPNHLLFNMATGSGKTLVMAALILYYYKECGIRSFIFFVNQNAILGKTQDNFINASHGKYLFKENITIEGRRIRIREAEQFSNATGGTQDIQIKFTTIHKLHNDIYKENENSLLLSDLQKRNIVLLADEAHHLNAATGKKKKAAAAELEDASFWGELKESAKAEDVEKSWETTVCHFILNKQGKCITENKNALLEFTATVPENEEVQKKYDNKIIMKFDLKDFVLAGFTKHIRLVRSSLSQKQRILQALALNWYRQQIALKYNVSNFKSVILFRSRTIEDSKKDLQEFLKITSSVTADDLRFLGSGTERLNDEKNLPFAYEASKDIFERIKSYLKQNKIPLSRIADFIKEYFTERTCLITNSKTNKTQREKTDGEQDKLLNSLENIHNPIRAVFTVQRLTEGWDVLNLYDIVRLYHGRDTDSKNKKAGKSTTSEVQLIGRGVRYFPFAYQDLPANKRKFDSDINHELRILEEFYFHSDDDVKYLSELTAELKSKGLIRETRMQKTFALKKEASEFLNRQLLFVNEKKENQNRRLKTLPDDLKNLTFDYTVHSEYSKILDVKMNEEKQTGEFFVQASGSWKTICTSIKKFPLHIAQKAIHILNTDFHSYFCFENLRKRFYISSLNDFFEYLDAVKINVHCARNFKSIEEIENKTLLQIAIRFFLFCKNAFEEFDHPFVGSCFKLVPFKSCFAGEKVKLLDIAEGDNAKENGTLEAELKKLSWYALDSFWGTSEERALIEFVKMRMGNLEQKYEACLLRNEEVYKIFDFESGEGFCPDFLLFLKEKRTQKEPVFFQVFIEPKGAHLFEKDAWKEKFLKEIAAKYGIKKPILEQNEKYVLIGLPFFNSQDAMKSAEFAAQFSEYFGIS
ncbi:MAG: DEAD/DEAH box helicase family protein [Bacteroides sp.]|nr:DEAD/DEAH box helicase family protein [Prevotella sp.]MCM1408716.1 DEAD/DEAH box helicase family protein [Treponema brennaborense]MCM1470631.1 DEAD/DEAH box helicase family protein [Bacteroides sp.]